jgi:hypothetical protein
MTIQKELSPEEQNKLDSRLISAALNGNTQMVRTLLSAGADVHAHDDWALCVAAYDGHTDTVKALVAHIFAPDSWHGKSRAEIEAHATALYGKIKTYIPWNPITPERLQQAATLLADSAIACWHQVRPPPPPGFKISPLPAQPRAL